MALKASKKHVKEILELFKNGTSQLVLTGDARTGKTWMARAVSESAVREGDCFGTLWISMDQNYDEKSLYETIAWQLSLLTSEEEWEDGADNKRKEESVEDLKQKIRVKLDKEAEETKFLLLVLDCEGEKTTEDDIRNKLGLDDVLKMKSGESFKLKVLITKRRVKKGLLPGSQRRWNPSLGRKH